MYLKTFLSDTLSIMLFKYLLFICNQYFNDVASWGEHLYYFIYWQVV